MLVPIARVVYSLPCRSLDDAHKMRSTVVSGEFLYQFRPSLLQYGVNVFGRAQMQVRDAW